MTITNIPIVDFYKYCLESADKNGFKWILCFLGREADSDKIYKQIQKYWSSLHDLTYNQILKLPIRISDGNPYKYCKI